MRTNEKGLKYKNVVFFHVVSEEEIQRDTKIKFYVFLINITLNFYSKIRA